MNKKKCGFGLRDLAYFKQGIAQEVVLEILPNKQTLIKRTDE